MNLLNLAYAYREFNSIKDVDIKKFIEEQGLADFPTGLGGCRSYGVNFESCGYDIVVFDGTQSQEKILKYCDVLTVIHHASLSETRSKKLLQYDGIQIIHDKSWDLQILLSKINEKRSLLFADLAKTCLIESLFCCQKASNAIKTADVFAPYWQKCASYYLADAICSLNNQRSSPSHMLELLRRSANSHINEHIPIATQTIGIERATPILLERMLKSTIGFSDLVEKNNHSQIIKQKHDFFVKNSMLSDCYFYLGYVNRENFVKIKDSLSKNRDLVHILKIAFDIEADGVLLQRQADLIQESCNGILQTLSSV